MHRATKAVTNRALVVALWGTGGTDAASVAGARGVSDFRGLERGERPAALRWRRLYLSGELQFACDAGYRCCWRYYTYPEL